MKKLPRLHHRNSSIMTLLGRRTRMITASVLLLTSGASAQVLVNGDFETGDFTGWTTSGSGSPSIDSTTPLAGDYSAILPVSAGGILEQSFDAITTEVEFSAIFTMPDPGGISDRGFNVLLRANSSGHQINLRVVDDSGTSVVQAYQSGWNQLVHLNGAVSYSEINSISVTMSDFGSDDNFNYSVTINSLTESDLAFVQNSDPGEGGMVNLAEVQFTSTGSAVSYEVDNVSLTVIPEPAGLALPFGAVCLLLVIRRRSR